jgi:mannosyl-oligosaccharide alpha-1,2-mannosidase
MYVYDPVRFSTYKDRWILAADSTIAHLASHPSSRPDLTYLAAYNSKTLSLGSGHLACFDGGNFILGGLVLKEQKYVDFGLELVASCENTYNQTLTGIGPEGFGWDGGRVPSDQKEFYERAGFYITSANYVLRPEVLESFYYAYRATGDRKYQDVSLESCHDILIQSSIANSNSGPTPASRPSPTPHASVAATARSQTSMRPTAVVSRTSRNRSSSPRFSSTPT